LFPTSSKAVALAKPIRDILGVSAFLGRLAPIEGINVEEEEEEEEEEEVEEEEEKGEDDCL
jgi:hypothetical protein